MTKKLISYNDAVSAGVRLPTTVSTEIAVRESRYDIKDYGAVGNGSTDDTTAIQAALTAASTAGGGTVIVPKSTGSYIFTALDIPSNVVFRGAGGTLKLKDNTTTAAIAYYPIQIAARTNVHLVDLIIDGNNTNNPGDTTNIVSDAITMVSCDRSSIRNCRITDAPDSGIMFSRCTNSSLLNNTITGARDCGVYANDGDGTLFSECLMEGNTFINCRYGGIAMKRLCQRAIVANNTIRDCGNGITLEETTAVDFSTNVTIIGNRMRHTGFNVDGVSGPPAAIGISIRGGSYVVCTGNHIEDVKNWGISTEGGKYNTFSSNFILQGNTGYGGVYVANHSSITGGAQHHTYVGNMIIGAPKGFWLTGVSGKPADNITLIGNHIISAYTTGLAVDQYVTNLTLIGNVFGGATNDVNINASAGVMYPFNNRLLNNTQSGTFNPMGTVKLLAVATGSRPSASAVGAGAMYYDTTLAKPGWSNGTVWKDAAGTNI